MDHNLTQRIRERAYEIWAASGCPADKAEQHWYSAETEILAAPKLALTAQPALTKRSSRPARKAKQQ
jgi:uncharacterized membrane protein